MEFLDRRKCLHPYTLDARERRPNVFVFTVDMIPPEFHQQPSACLDAMHRPAWAALDADSVCFRNAFSVSPLCGPSRASMFTGRYPYITVNEERAHDGCEVELRPDDPIYPEYLKVAGYLTAHAGKSHVGTAKFIRPSAKRAVRGIAGRRPCGTTRSITNICANAASTGFASRVRFAD